jgi:hypothetical protein
MTITVETTVSVNGQTKTFTASAETSGDQASAAQALLFAVRDDASEWAYETRNASTR